ncbi:hypothetical protein [Chryseobacterium sp.]|uniref:hypothetical protein n=1 Tax=Chryseobacterium sp. TaxID=1871047 RepID=UPI0035C6CA72
MKISGNYCSAFDTIKRNGQIIKVQEATLRQKDQIEKILNQITLPLNFTVLQGDVNNAIAIYQNNTNYIILNKSFLNKIDERTDNYWLSNYIIAHEIGHLLSLHLIGKYTSDSISKNQELEADKFAGAILSKLGCPLDKSTLIFKSNYLQNPSGSNTHPNSKDRIDAITKGWEGNLSNSISIADPPLPINIDEVKEKNRNYIFTRDDLDQNSIMKSENFKSQFDEAGEGIILSLTPIESEGNFTEQYDIDKNYTDEDYKKQIKLFKERIKYFHSSCRIKVKKWTKNTYLTKETSDIEVYFFSEHAGFPLLPHNFGYNDAKFNIYKRHFVVGQPISFKLTTNIAEGYLDAIDFYEFQFLKK